MNNTLPKNNGVNSTTTANGAVNQPNKKVNNVVNKPNGKANTTNVIRNIPTNNADSSYLNFYKKKIELQNLLVQIKILFSTIMVDLCAIKNITDYKKIANSTIYKIDGYNEILSKLRLLANDLSRNTISNNSQKFSNNTNIGKVNTSGVNKKTMSPNSTGNFYNTILKITIVVDDMLNNIGVDKNGGTDRYDSKIKQLRNTVANANIKYFEYIKNIVDMYIYTVLSIIDNYESTHFTS
jgi:hypothetical protein